MTITGDEPPVIVTLVLLCVQFIVGLLMLPSPQIGAVVFDPFRRFFMTVIRAVTCGKLEAKISEMEKWDGRGDVESLEVVYTATKQQDDVFASVWV